MLLTSFYINYEKISALVVTGDNTTNTKNTLFLLKMLTSAKNYDIFFSIFFKLHKILNICAKFQVFGISSSETK